MSGRPHDDIAALKRLLREVFTNQIQMERRVSALEPEDTVASFDPLERSRKGWGSLSGTGKARVELSGNLVMGSALLYSKARYCYQHAAVTHSHTLAEPSQQASLKHQLQCHFGQAPPLPCCNLSYFLPRDSVLPTSHAAPTAVTCCDTPVGSGS